MHIAICKYLHNLGLLFGFNLERKTIIAFSREIKKRKKQRRRIDRGGSKICTSSNYIHQPKLWIQFEYHSRGSS